MSNRRYQTHANTRDPHVGVENEQVTPIIYCTVTASGTFSNCYL